MVGAGGIEPPNGGIKIHCLTAWLRPKSQEKGYSGSLRGLQRLLSAPIIGSFAYRRGKQRAAALPEG